MERKQYKLRVFRINSKNYRTKHGAWVTCLWIVVMSAAVISINQNSWTYIEESLSSPKKKQIVDEKNDVKRVLLISLTVRRHPEGKFLTMIACISYETKQSKNISFRRGDSRTSSMIGPLVWKSSRSLKKAFIGYTSVKERTAVINSRSFEGAGNQLTTSGDPLDHATQ